MTTPSLTRRLRSVDGARSWAKAPIAPFTTIGTGGRAAMLVTVSTPQALAAVLAVVAGAEVPWACLGAGSNLLVSDQGFRGVLVKLDDDFHYVEGLPQRGPSVSERDGGGREAAAEPGGQTILTVGSGAYLSRLSAVAAEAGLSGLEFACGIPGSVGGGVVMNAGAHGSSMVDVVEAVELVSAEGGGWISAGDLQWGYRHCGLPEGAVVTAVRIRLTYGDATVILQQQRSLLRERRRSQPRGTRTFGSVFKNPPGGSAGRLLEAAGLKGVRRGGAEVSTVHANFIANTGDATTADVLTLMGLMRQGVHRMSGILLEPEVRLLGTSFPWEPAARDDGRSAGLHG